jgi:hypothetical protein
MHVTHEHNAVKRSMDGTEIGSQKIKDNKKKICNGKTYRRESELYR